LRGTLGANRVRLFEWKPRADCARNGSRPDHPLHPPITLYIRLLSRKKRPRARGSWKNRVRPQRRH